MNSKQRRKCRRSKRMRMRTAVAYILDWNARLGAGVCSKEAAGILMLRYNICCVALSFAVNQLTPEEFFAVKGSVDGWHSCARGIETVLNRPALAHLALETQCKIAADEYYAQALTKAKHNY